MSPAVLSQLNSPIAVVAIIAVIFGMLGLFLREASWFVRSMKGKGNPYYDTQKIMEGLNQTLSAQKDVLVSINTSMTIMNDRMARQEKVGDKTLEIVMSLPKGRGRA